MLVVTSLIIGGLLTLVWLAARVADVDIKAVAWLWPVVALSFAAVTVLTYGPVASFGAALLVVVAWAYRDKPWVSPPLGLAVAIRLWPGLVVVGFRLSGRRRAAVGSVGVAAGLNLVGLLLPGVNIGGMYTALVDSATTWLTNIQNASGIRPLAALDVPVMLGVVGVAAMYTMLSRRYKGKAIPLSVLGGLVASPLSWPVYSLVTIPVGIVAWANGSRLVRLLVVSAFVPLVGWLWVYPGWRGTVGLVSLLILTAAVILSGTVGVRPEPVAQVGDR